MLALFDLDNTLIDRSAGLEQWARRFVHSRSLPQEAEIVICDWLRERAHPEDFVDLGATLGLIDDPSDLWHEYVDGVARSVRCFPGTREGLEALRGTGWAIGIATNGAGDIQRAKLAATGLTPLFDGICVSGEVGARKPERRLFEAAATECGASLSAGGWMIGDNPETDMGGARAAGLRTLWVANGREWADGLRKPDVMVPGIVEAIEVLRGTTV
ncbi:HAD family hydrolase [Streptomyces triticiradicis]|uniref:HAD family hydrolase n=1 Tax=Streptomyces triticiradicis TaxID=2651189 RepID=A0A7J5D8Q7_9ACTN|nr:HAD family hydrolase [Streptomyces triticiradicis]KAB1983412.1 HAD family hydrolase [Streptomyces triticiradicis]